MKIAIKTNLLEVGCWMASIDYSSGEGNKPGAIKYGDTPEEAHNSLRDCLISKGHEVINHTYKPHKGKE